MTEMPTDDRSTDRRTTDDEQGSGALADGKPRPTVETVEAMVRAQMAASLGGKRGIASDVVLQEGHAAAA